MATFTDAQVTDIAEIVGSSSLLLDEHLTYYASSITEDDKTRILERVTDFQLVEHKDIGIRPTESNKGVLLSPDKKRNLIRKQICSLIYWQYTGDRLQRG